MKLVLCVKNWSRRTPFPQIAPDTKYDGHTEFSVIPDCSRTRIVRLSLSKLITYTSAGWPLCNIVEKSGWKIPHSPLNSRVGALNEPLCTPDFAHCCSPSHHLNAITTAIMEWRPTVGLMRTQPRLKCFNNGNELSYYRWLFCLFCESFRKHINRCNRTQ